MQRDACRLLVTFLEIPFLSIPVRGRPHPQGGSLASLPVHVSRAAGPWVALLDHPEPHRQPLPEPLGRCGRGRKGGPMHL